MGKSRIMGAGNAGASSFIALNGNQGGGNKKQGLPSTIGRIASIDYTRSFGNNRDVVFSVNQLGGVGKGRSMFSSSADGVSKPKTFDPFIATNGNIYQAVSFVIGGGLKYDSLNPVDISEGIAQFAISNNTTPEAVLDIENWDTSRVTVIWNLFNGQNNSGAEWGSPANRTFNRDISRWDVSNVTNFEGLFYENPSFNQDISGWNVSKASNNGTTYKGLEQMFLNATSFNQDIRGWAVPAGVDIGGMFTGATAMLTRYNDQVGNDGNPLIDSGGTPSPYFFYNQAATMP